MSNLSILTVVKDGLNKLPATLESVANQSSEPYEHIICIGMPDDGSLNYLQQYNGHAIKIFSQNDDGLYDALNCAIGHAKGEYILFLHAGDKLSGKNYVKNFFNSSIFDTDVFYGNVSFFNGKGPVRRCWRGGRYKAVMLHFGWMPPHTCSIVRRTVYNELGLFDTSFKISGDYDLFVKMMRAGKSFAYLSDLWVEMEIGGVSTRDFHSHLVKLREDFRAVGGRFFYASFVVIMKRLRKVIQFWV